MRRDWGHLRRPHRSPAEFVAGAGYAGGVTLLLGVGLGLVGLFTSSGTGMPGLTLAGIGVLLCVADVLAGDRST
jgi:hypothetical protein